MRVASDLDHVGHNYQAARTDRLAGRATVNRHFEVLVVDRPRQINPRIATNEDVGRVVVRIQGPIYEEEDGLIEPRCRGAEGDTALASDFKSFGLLAAGPLGEIEHDLATGGPGEARNLKLPAGDDEDRAGLELNMAGATDLQPAA